MSKLYLSYFRAVARAPRTVKWIGHKHWLKPQLLTDGRSKGTWYQSRDRARGTGDKSNKGAAILGGEADAKEIFVDCSIAITTATEGRVSVVWWCKVELGDVTLRGNLPGSADSTSLYSRNLRKRFREPLDAPAWTNKHLVPSIGTVKQAPGQAVRVTIYPCCFDHEVQNDHSALTGFDPLIAFSSSSS